jgi:hypothetical protein
VDFSIYQWSGECITIHTLITPRAIYPATTKDRTEQHTQPIGNKKYKRGEFKTDSDWPKSEEDKLESRQKTLKVS